MLLRDKLRPKIEPYKNLKAPNEKNEFPVTERNHHEDKRVLILFCVFFLLTFLASLVFPKEEDTYQKTFKFGQNIDGSNIVIQDTFDKVLPDSRIIRLFIRFHNPGYKGKQTYDINMKIERGDNAEDFLNGTYKDREIQPGTEQQIFSDACPKYKSVKAILEFSAKNFDEESEITLTWCVGNSRVTMIKVIYHYVAIAILVFMIVYFVKNIGFRSPEETITFVVVIAAIIHIGPLYFVRLNAPSRAFLIIDRVGENVLGAVLNFAALSVFALTMPCCPEILEGNVVIAWVFFVVTAFFDVLPFVVILYGELSFGLTDGVKMFGKIGSAVAFFFGFSLLMKQKKEYRTVPTQFRYRFWAISYLCIAFSVPYSLLKLLSIFTNVLSVVAQDFISVMLALGTAMAFASLFWSRKFAPFNYFHTEDAKWKLE